MVPRRDVRHVPDQLDFHHNTREVNLNHDWLVGPSRDTLDHLPHILAYLEFSIVKCTT